MTIEVELDVFSGRPNPRWKLDVDTEAKVASLLQRDTNAAVPTPAPARLGYRGFILHLSDGSLLSAREVRVAEGVASTGVGPNARHVLVPGLEELLLESAARAGHHDLIAAMRPGTK